MTNEEKFAQDMSVLRDLDSYIVHLKRNYGLVLSDIKKDKLYKCSYGHWNDFLKDFGIPYGEAHDSIEFYNKITKYKNADLLPMRILKRIWKLLTDDNADDLINKAQSLPYHEFIDEINILKNETKSYREVCNHEEKEGWSKCKICGKWEHQEEVNQTA